MRIEWEFHPNEDMASMHIDRLVPEWSSWDIGKEPQPGDELSRLLLEAPGVSEVSLGTTNRYAIRITRGRVFSWDEILKAIEKVVREYFTENT